MARAHLARPTDAPPAAHDPSSDPDTGPSPTLPVGEAPLLLPDELPRHVAIIMDGNRRWARQRDLPELDGHAAGVEAIRELLRHAVRRGVPVLTLYAFSRENWARPTTRWPGCSICSRRHPERDRGARARRASGSGCSAGSTSCPMPPAARSARRSMRRPAAIACCSTSRSTMPAGPRSSTLSGGSWTAGRPPPRSTKQRSAVRSTRRACPIPISSSAPAASSASRTS